MGSSRAAAGCGNMKKAIKVLRKMGCTVERKFRTGEWLITLPDGSVHLASGTRKDTPGHVRGIIKKLNEEHCDAHQ